MAKSSALQTLLIGLVPLLAFFAFRETLLPLVQPYVDLALDRRAVSAAVPIERSAISIVTAAITHYSHAQKVAPFAVELSRLGYDVTFISGSSLGHLVDNSTVKFVPVDGPAELIAPEELPQLAGAPEFKVQDLIFVSRIPGQGRTLQQVFDKYPADANIVYLHDIAFFGLLPQTLGAPGRMPTVDLGIGIACLPFDSDDTFAFPSAELPATGPDRVARHRRSQFYANAVDGDRSYVADKIAQMVYELGAVKRPVGFFPLMGSVGDYFLQIGLPEFEYPRSDLPTEVVYLGVPDALGGDRTLPPWWDEMLAAKRAGKKVVVLSQGSYEPDMNQLLIPALKWLQHRDDLFIVATTVVPEPDQVEGLETFANSRTEKFVPYDLLLPQADLLLAFAGYGSVIQAIQAGVPMALAGTRIDKGHNAALAEHKGIAINFKTDNPTESQVLEAVNTILGTGASKPDSEQKRKVQILSNTLKTYKTLEILDRTILEAINSRRT